MRERPKGLVIKTAVRNKPPVIPTRSGLRRQSNALPPITEFQATSTETKNNHLQSYEVENELVLEKSPIKSKENGTVDIEQILRDNPQLNSINMKTNNDKASHEVSKINIKKKFTTFLRKFKFTTNKQSKVILEDPPAIQTPTTHIKDGALRIDYTHQEVHFNEASPSIVAHHYLPKNSIRLQKF
ncbi:uncharacterized protein BX663DRAFT_541231 [Cokeromyces recurvatus]|uniref:uncharacterized protein n=1 Tax=Cokeromyces recurvatus TaxID=90255 RepID=UPI00221FDBE5|nr:uncharacterized protein BX663DRAFT_541231 [Cokeromyces recurvatus]KAI7904938.1 hypothetical protein BX663DRAFT_541231 [Cokeromyces recurvatus]